MTEYRSLSSAINDIVSKNEDLRQKDLESQYTKYNPPAEKEKKEED